jgi:preprotein translocase subunit YajC
MFIFFFFFLRKKKKKQKEERPKLSIKSAKSKTPGTRLRPIEG